MMVLPAATLDDVCFIARRVLAMLRDPRSNALRLARLVDTVDNLSDEVHDEAGSLFGDRGRVASTAHAITILGFDRLEAVIRRFLYREFERIAEQAPAATPAPASPAALDMRRFDEARARVRYMAV